MGPMFILGFCFLNIVWEFLEIDFRWKIRDFLKKNFNKLFFVEDFPNHCPFFLWAVRLPVAKEAKDSINRLIDYGVGSAPHIIRHIIKDMTDVMLGFS